MTDNSFFNEQEDQSHIKAIIVDKYFKAWASVILSNRRVDKIGYIDLFAGPGRYSDGAMSTPLMVLSTALNDPQLSPKLLGSLVTVFNDKDTKNVQSLKTAIDNLPKIKTLKYPPQYFNEEVGEKFEREFGSRALIPSFFFVDPWGYKGLSLKLVNAVLKDWGSDCVFFFNYNRINMGLSNEAVFEHMAALFGEVRATRLQAELKGITDSAEREAQVLEELVTAFKELGAQFVLPFRFRNERGTRTTHYLVFVTKHFRGYEIMKSIMANMSSSEDQGVASFEYSPATERQPTLFSLQRPLDNFGDELLKALANRNLTLPEVYEQYEIQKATRFIQKHYRQVLIELEEAGKIIVTRPSGAPRRKNTFPEDLVAHFPK